MQGWRAAAVCGLVVATLASACDGGGSGTAQPADSPSGQQPAAASTSTPPSDDPRLWIQEGDEPVAFENGHTVRSKGLDIEIYVAPYPPARSANIDFYVLKRGTPVEGANVTLQFDMTVMEHGPFALTANPTGGGHYLAPLDFIMTGDFLINVAVDAGGSESVVNLFVRAIR